MLITELHFLLTLNPSFYTMMLGVVGNPCKPHRQVIPHRFQCSITRKGIEVWGLGRLLSPLWLLDLINLPWQWQWIPVPDFCPLPLPSEVQGVMLLRQKLESCCWGSLPVSFYCSPVPEAVGCLQQILSVLPQYFLYIFLVL